MPTDLFSTPDFQHLQNAPQSTGSAAPQDLLAQNNPANMQPNSWMNTLFNPMQSGRDIGAGVLSGLRDTAQGAIGLAGGIANRLPLPPVMQNALQSGAQQANAAIPNTDFSSAMGVNNPNLLDKTLQFGASTLPMGGMSLAKATPDILSGAANLAKSAYLNLSPQKYAENIIQKLGNGMSMEGNAQDLASKIQNAYKTNASNVSQEYLPIFNNPDVPLNKSIYEGINQNSTRIPNNNFNNINDVIDFMNDNKNLDLENTSDLKDFLNKNNGYSFKSNSDLLDFFNSSPSLENNGEYSKLSDEIFSTFSPDAKRLNTQFNNSPTFQNAHQLQSQLGSEIRNLQFMKGKGDLQIAGQDRLSSYINARDSLKNDMNDYLNNINPNLSQQYNKASYLYATKVAPYLDDSRLSQISQGDINNPKPSMINSIFSSPESDINGVTNDLGPRAMNQIIFNNLGKLQGSSRLTPSNLMDKYAGLDSAGLKSYVNPDVEDAFNGLNKRMKTRNWAIGGLGALGASAVAKSLHKYL